MTWPWFVLAALILAAGAVLPVFFHRDRDSAGGREAISARARYAQLGYYVEHPVATTDPEAERLLRAGRERWNSAGAVLADAGSARAFKLAGQIADEGLAAVGKAYDRLGLSGPRRRP